MELKAILRLLFYGVIIRFVTLIILGLNIRRREHLPEHGPAIIAANHNSHLDALVLVSMMPLRLLPQVRPVAAADYFMKSRAMAWFALHVIGIIPIERGAAQRGEDPLAPCYDALERGDILIIFPEGSRGEPEQRAEMKKGISYLAERHPDVPVISLFMHGLGKAMPKGEAMLVPFFCDIFVANVPLHWQGDRAAFMQQLVQQFDRLEQEAGDRAWE